MKKQRVMIVGDASAVIPDLSLQVQESGYAICAVATSWDEAKKILLTDIPDSVLAVLGSTDYKDGIRFGKYLHDHRGIPVIYLAVSKEDSILEEALGSRPSGFLVNPFGKRELRAALAIAHFQCHAGRNGRSTEDELKRHRAHLEAIIARKTAELRKSNARLHRLLHSIDQSERKLATDSLDFDVHEDREVPQSIEEGIITVDTDQRVVLINAGAARMLGVTEDAVAGKKVRDVFRFSDESLSSHLESSMATMLSNGSSSETFESVAVLTANNQTAHFVVYFEPIPDMDGKTVGIVLAFRDALENRKKEYEAIRIQKFESLALMIRGIAHDFNNILSSVLANIQLTKVETAEGSPAYVRLNHAEDSILKARELSQQMLTYSGGEITNEKTSALPSLIRQTAIFSLRGSRSKCEFSLPDRLRDVPIDADLVRLILNDLFLFMDGSMHGAGTIVVSAEDMNPSTVGSGTTAPVDYVRIRLHSSEFVIPLESQEGLFRPGSSMEFAIDLSFAESMIRKSGGVLDVQSRQDLGTDLILYLPASHLEPREKVSKKITGIKKSDLIGRKKILLMDDEEAILSATSEMLKFLGYEVLTAQNGESAVPLYQSARDTGVPFDAVILDITIPGGLGAKETLAKLVTINPAVKAIISSGYSTNPMILDYRSFGFAAAVVKPYGFKELGEALDIIFR